MKAILVIDLPSACDECHLNHDNWYCQVTVKDIEYKEDEDGFTYYPIPSWCPLKPLPPHEKALMFGSEFEMFSEKVGEIVLDAIEEIDETDNTKVKAD